MVESCTNRSLFKKKLWRQYKIIVSIFRTKIEHIDNKKINLKMKSKSCFEKKVVLNTYAKFKIYRLYGL